MESGPHLYPPLGHTQLEGGATSIRNLQLSMSPQLSFLSFSRALDQARKTDRESRGIESVCVGG